MTRLVFRDDVNMAIAFAERVERRTPQERSAAMGDGSQSIAGGILSLLEERDRLRKLVKEAWVGGGDATTKNCPGCGYQDPKDWEASKFPGLIESPWTV